MLSVVILSVFALRSYSVSEVGSGYIIIFGILIPFTIAAVARYFLQHLVIRRTHPLHRPQRQFFIDVGLYLLIAASLFCGELLIGYSLAFGLKIVVWTMTVGYFASVDAALDRERSFFLSSNHLVVETENKNTSMASQLNVVFSIAVLISIIACAVTAYSHINTNGGSVNVREAFIVDVLFIVGIVVSFTIRLVYSFSLNLQFLFDTQIKALKNIQNGDLDNTVPILSQNEFATIAQQTNILIEELREKQKIQKTLEQIVSPDIMKKLLDGNARDLKEGQEFEIAIMFCDLRKFTTYTENTPPEEVIFFLNAYFTKIADIVAEHNGIVNKFMGDAILAIYGVDDDQRYIEDAMNTAWDIVMHSDCVKMRDGTTFDIGIGVHTGRATACTIGSSERYEYTFIGDAVNTASRFDDLSKQLGYKIITSAKVYEALSADSQSKFADLGVQPIRGKSIAMHIYGAVEKNPPKSNNIVQISSLSTGITST